MTTSPGWYADPGGSQLLRWWDGAQWSSHTAPAPSYAAPAGRPQTPSSRRRTVIGAIVVGVVIVIAIAVGAAVAIPAAVSRARAEGPPSCGLVVTSHMTPEAAAYVRLATETNRARDVISRRVAVDPHAPATNENIQAEIDLQVAFVHGLQLIPFTGQAAVDARALAAARGTLINALGRVLTDRSAANVAEVHLDRDLSTSTKLRLDLGLFTGGCTFWNPI